MSAIGLVVAIALPIGLVLIGLVFSGRRQQSEFKKRSQARSIKTAAEDLLEALEFLILVDNFTEIQTVVLERVVHLYQRYKETLPEKDARALAVDFDKKQYEHKIENSKTARKVLKSDREIRYAKQQVTRILKALGLMVKQKMISETAMLEYRRHLRMAMLDREVDTYTVQGDVAAKRGDVVTATNYYKAAKKLLIEFDLQYPEKNDKIRNLSNRASALYNGGELPADHLSQALLNEEMKGKNDFGIPSDPSAEEKQKF